MEKAASRLEAEVMDVNARKKTGTAWLNSITLWIRLPNTDLKLKDFVLSHSQWNGPSRVNRQCSNVYRYYSDTSLTVVFLYAQLRTYI